MCEWCDRLVFMPSRWDRHAFGWAEDSVWKIGRHNRRNRNRLFNDLPLRPGLETWCDNHRKYFDIGGRYYPGGHGSRFYSPG